MDAASIEIEPVNLGCGGEIRGQLDRRFRRWTNLDDVAKELSGLIAELVKARAPHLIEQFGIDSDTTAEILIVADDNPDRIRSPATFAKLTGISPSPTGSGMTSGRYRINHGDHRQLNAAIYRTVVVRMRLYETTIAEVARRTAGGESKRDIIR